MDGSNRGIIIHQDIHWPNGLTIDYNAEKIYWIDAKLFYIAKANYDGLSRQEIFRTPMPSQCVLGHPFALTLYENKIYWTDWKTDGIRSMNKTSGTRCQMVLSNAYSPMDIQAFEPRRQLPRSGKSNFHLILYTIMQVEICLQSGHSNHEHLTFAVHFLTLHSHCGM